MAAPDALLTLQDGYVTKTADFDGSSVDFGLQLSQTSHPIWARIRYYNAKNTSGSNSVTFGIKSSKNNSTFNTRVLADPIDLTTTAKRGVVHLNLLDLNRYNLLTVDFNGAGSGATVTYDCSVGAAKI